MLQDLMIFHVQGWGQMGVNTAAFTADKTPLPLRIAGKAYDTGLGTHAPSESVLLLDGLYSRFECEVGVQFQDTSAGSVLFKVFVDGKEAFNSGVLHDGDAPVPVSVDLTGASELQLITENAGDGITCDMANWADVKLTAVPNTTRETKNYSTSVNVAPFATVESWDPARMNGTHASRIQPVPVEDLFTETDLLPDANGFYAAPVYPDGRACIGLEWLERRRLARVEVEFTESFKGIEAVGIEYWQMKRQNSPVPGGSRWQGDWAPADGTLKVDGARIIFTPSKQDQGGALKIRWVIPSVTTPVFVKSMSAYTRSAWKDANITIHSESAGQFTLYNGAYNGADTTLTRKYAQGDAITLDVRYCPPRRWQITDRTVLRFETPDGSFGVAVDDVLDKGAVYVEHAGLLVCDAAKDQTVEAYKASIKDEKTVLERVRIMPDQTLEQSMEHVHRPEGDLGPTLLSLAADNRKFVAGRDGSLSYDDRPEVYNHHSSQAGEYRCRFTPRFGDGEGNYVTRQLIEDYLPIPVSRTVDGTMEYKQTTFVAPFGEVERPGAPWWLCYQPLGVVEYRILNTGVVKQDFALALDFKVDGQTPAEATLEGASVLVRGNNTLHAIVNRTDDKTVPEVQGGVVTLRGSLDARKSAVFTVYFPRWENAKAEDLNVVPSVTQLVTDTEAYWRRIMNQGIQIEAPESLVENLIPASRMHCMLAARNEDFVRIAPWIGSINYGPLESEANSILRGMLVMGEDDFVRRGLEYFMVRYNEDGYVSTGYTLMGTGWHLWTLGEYYAMTKNTEWLKQWAPEVARVCRWIVESRKGTMRLDAKGEKVPEYGLMPPGVGADWEVYAYYFYLQGYYCAGLREAAKGLVDIGYEGADALLADAMSYQEDILRSYKQIQAKAPVFPLKDGTWTPEYPTHAFAPCPIGNLYPSDDAGRSWCYDVELGAHHLIPFGVLAPDSQDAGWIMEHMEDVYFLHPGWFYYEDQAKNEADWFNIGGFSKVQPYYSRTGEVHAQRDDVKPFVRTYYNSFISLLNREDLSLWEHFMNGAYNKTHETGYFLHQSRLMLVQERGDELWLAPFITSNWLRDNMRVAVKNAPTFFGVAGYSIESRVSEGLITAHIDPPASDTLKAVVIRLRHPEDKRLVRAECDGAQSFTIDADKSTVRVVPSGSGVDIRAYYE